LSKLKARHKYLLKHSTMDDLMTTPGTFTKEVSTAMRLVVVSDASNYITSYKEVEKAAAKSGLVIPNLNQVIEINSKNRKNVEDLSNRIGFDGLYGSWFPLSDTSKIEISGHYYLTSDRAAAISASSSVEYPGNAYIETWDDHLAISFGGDNFYHGRRDLSLDWLPSNCWPKVVGIEPVKKLIRNEKE
jgi:hypothetical protein